MSFTQGDGSNPLSNILRPPSDTYESFEGAAYAGDLKIMKVANVSYNLSYSSGLYYEVDTDEGAPFRGAPTVQGTIGKAFINSFEWLLTFGKKNNDNSTFKPKFSYGASGTNTKLSDMMNVQGVMGPSSVVFEGSQSNKFYPVKFDMRIKANTKHIINGVDDKVYEIVSTLRGCIINTFGINIGTGAAVIPVGPLNFVGEEVVQMPVEVK